MSDELPKEFGGWLEEHPKGAFLILHSDGDHSPVLLTYEAVGEYLDRVVAEGRWETMEKVVRVRYAHEVSEPLDRGSAQALSGFRDVSNTASTITILAALAVLFGGQTAWIVHALDALGARIDAIERRLVAIEAQLVALVERVARIEGRLGHEREHS